MLLRATHDVRRNRRGSVVPIVGLLLTVLLGFLAMTFDLGRSAVVRTQLQGAADSAALAGASALGTDNLLVSNGVQSGDMITAQSRAQTFAQSNWFDLNGTKSVVLNTVNDVTFGILTNPGDLSQSMAFSGSSPLNSVRVQTSVDPSHGGSLTFLFAPILGQKTTTVQATATATVQLFAVNSVKALTGLRSPILPITMSFSDWQQMVNNQTGQDTYQWSTTTGQMFSGSDGLQEQQLYPGSNVSSSNNGLIQFGTGSHSNAVLKDQILNGPTYDQMIAQWPPSGAPPWNAQHQFTISADPGWRATTFDDLSSVEDGGNVRLIPLNDGTNPGNGGNGNYTIVALAPVRVTYSNKGGKNGGYALVQSAVIIDPTVVPSTTTLAGSGQGGVPVARLTR